MDVHPPKNGMYRYWSIATSKIFKNRGSMGFHGIPWVFFDIPKWRGCSIPSTGQNMPKSHAMWHFLRSRAGQDFSSSSLLLLLTVLRFFGEFSDRSEFRRGNFRYHIFTPSTLFCGGFKIHAVPKVYRGGCWPRFFSGARKIGTSGRRGASLNCWPPRIPSGKSPCY